MKKQTPAEIARQINAYIEKQNDTLQRYPVGPLANAAKLNRQKGMKALQALKQENEMMRVKTDPMAAQAQAKKYGGKVKKMEPGGDTNDAGAGVEPGTNPNPGGDTGYTARDLLFYELVGTYGYHPTVALAAMSPTAKENTSGGAAVTERDYSNTPVGRIRDNFGKYLKDYSDDEVNQLKKDPEAFFNVVYGNRMGNSADEGYKYRGRGLIQITGKDQYRRVSQGIFGDDRLLENPDLLGSDNYTAARAAAYYLEGQGTPLSKYGIDVTQPLTAEGQDKMLHYSYGKVAGVGPEGSQPGELERRKGDISDSLGTMETFVTESMPFATQLAEMPNYNQVVQQELQGVEAQLGYTPTDDTVIQRQEQVEAQGSGEQVYSFDPLSAEDQGLISFNDVGLAGEGYPAGKLEDGTVWGMNQYGDYNVTVPATSEYGQPKSYVIKADDWAANTGGKFDAESIAGGIKQGQSDHSAIPYVSRLDTYDPSVKYTSNFGMQSVNQFDVGSRTTGSFWDQNFVGNVDVHPQDGYELDSISKYYGGEGALSGAGSQMDNAISALMRDQGFDYDNPPPRKETTQRKYGYSGFGVSTGVSQKREYESSPEYDAWERAKEEATAQVAANPGTINWKDKNGKSRVGVGGYTPFSDYVSYATGNAEYESGLQQNIQNKGLIGDLISPGGLGIKALRAPAMAQGWRRAAVSGGTRNVGKAPRTIIIGEDGAKSFQYIDDAGQGAARITGSTRAAIPEVSSAGAGLPKLPAGNLASPPIKGVPGMKLAPTAGTGQAPTFIPATGNPLTTSVAGPAQIVGRGRSSQFLQPIQSRNALGQFGPNVPGLPTTAPVNNLGSGSQIFYGLPGGQGRNALGQFTRNRPGVLVPGNQMLGNAQGVLVPQGAAQTGLIPYGGLQRYAGLQRYTGAPPMNISAPGSQLALRGQRGLSLSNPTIRGAQGFDDVARAAQGFDEATVVGSSALRNANMIPTAARAALYGSQRLNDFDPRMFPRPEQVEPGTAEEDIQLGGGQRPVDQSGTQDGTETGDAGGTGTGSGAGSGGAGDSTIAGPEDPGKIPSFKTPLSLVPIATSMRATAEMRDAIQNMQAPAAPSTTVVPKFNYQSNIGQSLQDNRDAARAINQSSPSSATGIASQQAALAQRFKQDARMRAQDNMMRQQAEANYNNLASQVRAANTAIRNQYNTDMTAFNNQREMLLGANEAQGMRNIGTYAQDYIQNVLSPQYTAQIQAMGRPYDAAAMLPKTPFGMQEEETTGR